jgi:hypothetical protein
MLFLTSSVRMGAVITGLELALYCVFAPDMLSATCAGCVRSGGNSLTLLVALLCQPRGPQGCSISGDRRFHRSQL